MSDIELFRMCGRYPKRLSQFAFSLEYFSDSGKMATLGKMLPEKIAKGDRILIFSQFVVMLDILESFLQQCLQISFFRMDGNTPVAERQDLIDEFNAPDCQIPVFLLSTKACGLGVNLTSANTVILFDQDFNPHNDCQAEDRAHRVGQTRTVYVYRLVTKGTVEERINDVGMEKLRLDREIRDGMN